jgi:hypothetical protein
VSHDRCFSGAPDGERRCLIAIVHNGPVVFTQTVRSLMELAFGNRVETAKAAHGFAEIAFAWFSSFPRVDAMRDAALQGAIEDGFTHVLFLDADMVWPTDVLERMLRHHAAGIVGGLYVLKAPPYSPVALTEIVHTDGAVNHYAYLADYGEDLVAVSVLGMGCTLIPVTVAAAIGARPWFDYRNDNDGWPRVSEDVPFCERAKAAGVPLWLDPTVKCGHVTTTVVDERFHRRYQAGQRATAEAPMHASVPELEVGMDVIGNAVGEAIEGAPV